MLDALKSQVIPKSQKVIDQSTAISIIEPLSIIIPTGLRVNFKDIFLAGTFQGSMSPIFIAAHGK
jgi:hypothetical protein